MTADEATQISERNGWREQQRAIAATFPPFTKEQRELLRSMLDLSRQRALAATETDD